MVWKSLVTFLVFTLCLLGMHSTTATSASAAPLPSATERANATIKGLFRYYWSSDPIHPDAMFFFVCGQIGGNGGNARNKCGCTNPVTCLECYRWYDAVMLETVATYGIYTGNNVLYNTTADHIFDHSPYNAKWPAPTACTFMDDFSWFGLAYLRVYEWLKDHKWLERSLALYDWVWRYGWDEPCGGFFWTNCAIQLYKDSITIVEMLHFSAKLSFMFPGDPRYIKDAMKIWNWIFSFDNGNGLLSDQNLMSTGAVPEQCCNATHNDSWTKCHNSEMSGTSYNQGLLMSAAAYLYRTTGDSKYLNTGLKIFNAILENYTTHDGVFVDEPRSYPSYQAAELCIGTPSDPGGDFYSFQGIFMLHLGYFIDILAPVNALPYYTLRNIAQLVELTSNAAWTRSISWPPFNSTIDACNMNGLSSKVGLPKFHWWWNNAVGMSQQFIPPDPRHFFHKLELHCNPVGKNSTPLWVGKATTEDNCTYQCQIKPNCSKYSFRNYLTGPKNDCWHWPYDRDHSCSVTNYDFNVGIKRPVGNATCAGKCDSKEPQKLALGGVCYCDTDCTKHLDCCLDYASHCEPPDPISCKGLCNIIEPRAIPGGGYCWCNSGCNGWFTDNNSDGSCCPDYSEICLQTRMPACLDARTQASALGLFLAHMRASKLNI